MNINKYNKEKWLFYIAFLFLSPHQEKIFFPQYFFSPQRTSRTEKIKVRMSAFDPGAGWWPWPAGQGGGGG
jgi:hypothetical protein